MTSPIREVATLDFPVESYDWAFPRDDAARIDAHWARELAEKPRMFDGRVLLSHRWAIEGDTVAGACFETGFKSFLSWRDLGYPGPRVFNVFSMPALRAADGAFMLGEMSAGTSNAGKLYFPAGTPDLDDIGPDGRVDFEGSILRELEEETGLAPHEVELEPTWRIVVAPRPAVACMRIARSSLSAEALQARLLVHNAGAASPELVRLVPVRTRADLDSERMPDFMLFYLEDALQTPESGPRSQI